MQLQTFYQKCTLTLTALRIIFRLLFFLGKLKVLMEDNLGVIDFHPSNEAGIVYISETDLVAGSGFKQKLAKLRKVRKSPITTSLLPPKKIIIIIIFIKKKHYFCHQSIIILIKNN